MEDRKFNIEDAREANERGANIGAEAFFQIIDPEGKFTPGTLFSLDGKTLGDQLVSCASAASQIIAMSLSTVRLNGMPIEPYLAMIVESSLERSDKIFASKDSGDGE